jgi:hypothetical protein
MLALSSRKITVYVFLSCVVLLGGVFPQLGKAQYYGARFDNRKFNLGFTMGLNLSKTKLTYGSVNYSKKKAEGLKYVDASNIVGINIGMITNFRINNNWDFRFVPCVSLQQRNINFYYLRETVQRQIESSNIELPVLFKFKTDFYKNVRYYILGGLKYSINLVSDKKIESDPTLLKIDRSDMSLETGFGIDFYTDRVKLSPEIRYSLGFLNVYIPETSPEGAAIRQIRTHGFTLLLNFE